MSKTKDRFKTMDVYIVKSREDGHIERVFGIKAEAEALMDRINKDTDKGDLGVDIDQWPVEFKVSDHE